MRLPTAHRPILTVLLAAVASGPGASAQPDGGGVTVLQGFVRAATGGPLPGASVYLSGTTYGDAADARGRYRIGPVPSGAYQLVVSMVGYETETRDVVPAENPFVRVDVRLREATAALGGLQVEAERDRRWERHLARFTRALVGESSNAARVRLLNPEALRFRLRWGTLRAEADAPLVFENRALGYRLTYDLRAFAASASRVSYDGGERFEMLEPASDEEAARQAEARERAYRGSLRHLLRALLQDRVEEEGFSLRLVRDDRSGFGSRWPSTPASARRVMRVDSAGWGTLRVRGRLEITYREPEDPAYLQSDWFRERRSRPDPVQRSALVVERGRARVDPQGTPEDPFAITTSGYLAFERLADLVPEDYAPTGGARAEGR